MSRLSRTLTPAVALLAVFAACDDDSSGPDGVGLEAFIGTYVIEPEIAVVCPLELTDVTFTIDTIEVTDASEDSVWLRVPIGVSTTVTGELDTGAEAEFALAVTGEDGFAGDSPLEATTELGDNTFTGSGFVDIAGEFVGDDQFSADLAADFALQINGGASEACSGVSEQVTGTRVD